MKAQAWLAIIASVLGACVSEGSQDSATAVFDDSGPAVIGTPGPSFQKAWTIEQVATTAAKAATATPERRAHCGSTPCEPFAVCAGLGVPALDSPSTRSALLRPPAF